MLRALIREDVKVSIPFKREGTFRRTLEVALREIDVMMFQFPSNGKAHSDPHQARNGGRIDKGFNSLQTGRHIQTLTRKERLLFMLKKFQFPSNGKAHSDFVLTASVFAAPSCFNSLQTGRHIQTNLTEFSQNALNSSFNSLQTGRHIQTRQNHHPLNRRSRRTFQFPSNGKAHSDSD